MCSAVAGVGVVVGFPPPHHPPHPTAHRPHLQAAERAAHSAAFVGSRVAADAAALERGDAARLEIQGRGKVRYQERCSMTEDLRQPTPRGSATVFAKDSFFHEPRKQGIMTRGP